MIGYEVGSGGPVAARRGAGRAPARAPRSTLCERVRQAAGESGAPCLPTGPGPRRLSWGGSVRAASHFGDGAAGPDELATRPLLPLLRNGVT